MIGGLTGKLLRVDLARRQVRIEATPEDLFRRFIGARGVGAAMLYRELPAGCDPLGPGNKLIFLTGPLEATLAPGANKITASFRSPLTGTYSFSLCGGHLAPELKFAGFDGLVVEGQASRPVYLWIHDGKAELRDAAHLWGGLTHDTEDRLRQELKEPEARIAVIGPAGEQGVRYAVIQTDYHREFGRGGAGAVMGSKNLKAIAIRGTGQVAVADPQALVRLAESVYADLAAHPKGQARRRFGTPEMVEGTNNLGYWATNNFQTGHFDGAAKLTGPALKASLYIGDNACYACPVGCGKVSGVTQGKLAGSAIEGAEFETLGLLGANCGVSDPRAITAAAALCDAYGFDTMSAGAAISFAMQANECGLLSPAQTGGLALQFGNAETLVTLCEQIGQRQGLGRLLGEGAKIAAQVLGAPDLAMHVKGQELATYEPRGVVGMGLTYAISPKGGHHMIAPTMGLEVAGAPTRRWRSEGKAQMVRDTQIIMAWVDSLSLCSTMRFALGPQAMVDLLNAVTGLGLSVEAALQCGERIANIERLYNLREGFTRAEDTLPKRLLNQPMPDGPSTGHVVPLAEMLDEYYRLMGWTPEGVPTAEKLAELGLSGLLEG